jgi:hypothetical protein
MSLHESWHYVENSHNGHEPYIDITPISVNIHNNISHFFTGRAHFVLKVTKERHANQNATAAKGAKANLFEKPTGRGIIRVDPA